MRDAGRRAARQSRTCHAVEPHSDPRRTSRGPRRSRLERLGLPDPGVFRRTWQTPRLEAPPLNDPNDLPPKNDSGRRAIEGQFLVRELKPEEVVLVQRLEATIVSPHADVFAEHQHEAAADV